MTARERLVQALEQAGAPDAMVSRAARGAYDDIASSSPTPITDLVREARANGLVGIAERAVAGEFDATREEWRARPRGPS